MEHVLFSVVYFLIVHSNQKPNMELQEKHFEKYCCFIVSSDNIFWIFKKRFKEISESFIRGEARDHEVSIVFFWKNFNNKRISSPRGEGELAFL